MQLPEELLRPKAPPRAPRSEFRAASCGEQRTQDPLLSAAGPGARDEAESLGLAKKTRHDPPRAAVCPPRCPRVSGSGCPQR